MNPKRENYQSVYHLNENSAEILERLKNNQDRSDRVVNSAVTAAGYLLTNAFERKSKGK